MLVDNGKNEFLTYVGARIGSVTDLADGSLQGQNRTSIILADVKNRIATWNKENPQNRITRNEAGFAIAGDIVSRVAEEQNLDPNDRAVRQKIFDSAQYTALNGVGSVSATVCPEMPRLVF